MDTVLKLEALMEHADWVRRLARSLVADPARADDVAQETWLAALRSPPREATNVRAWLTTVVRNAARRAGRAEERRERREASAASLEALPSAAELVEQADLQREIAALVIALDEPYRHTLLLRYYQGLGPSDIAARTGVPLNTVRSRLARGLAELRERLDRRFAGRDAWCAALAPLARSPLAAPVASTAIQGSTAVSVGALIMAAKLKWAVVASAACLGLWWLWPRAEVRVADTPARASSEATAASLETPAVAPESRDDERAALTSAPETRPAAEAPPRVVTVVRGRCVDLSGAPVAGLEIEWIDEREARVRLDVLGVGNSRLALTEEVRKTLADEAAAARAFPELLRGARGVAEALRGEKYRRPSVLTAADGTFTVEQESTGGKVDVARKDLKILDRVRVAEFPDTLYIVAGCVEVGGTVRDRDGRPIRSARVEWDFRIQGARTFPYLVESGGNWMISDATDDFGRFRFERLPAVPSGRLRVSAEGFVTNTVPTPEQSELQLVVVLDPGAAEPGRHIAGRVLHEDGRPAAGARVDFGQDAARAGDDGSFLVKLTTEARAAAPLSAALKGARPAALEQFGERLLANDSRLDGVVLVLGAELPPIRGRVLDANGAPCVGWSLGLLDAQPLGTSSRSLEWVAAGELPDPATDAEGRFLLGGLDDRPYRVRAWSTETMVAVESEPVRAGNDRVELRVPGDALVDRVVGRVVSRRGTPIDGVEILLGRRTVVVGETVSMIWKPHGKTDAQGRFELRNVPRHGCLIGADDARIRGATVELDEERIGRELVLEVDFDLRFRVEPRTAGEFDDFAVLDRAGAVLTVVMHLHQSESWIQRVGARDDGFPVCSTTEDAETLVLYRGETEVRRVPLTLRPGEITLVAP